MKLGFNMTWHGNFKDLKRRTTSDKTLWHEAFNIAKNSKYDIYQWGLASIVYKFINKNISDSGIKNENMLNKELAKEWHKPIIRKI